MLEEGYGKAEIKKMQIMEWHTRFRDCHVSVNAYPRCVCVVLREVTGEGPKHVAAKNKHL
jgi:hypothetical protein